MLKIHKKTFALICMAILIIAAILISMFFPLGKPPVQLYYFYENVCGSCNMEGEFLNLFTDKVGDVNDDVKYEMNMVNTFKDGNDLYNQICGEKNVLEDERDKTMLFIGDRYIAKSTEIERLLRINFCLEFGIADNQTAVYYHRPDCGDCAAVAPIIEAKTAAYSNLDFVKIDVTPTAPKQQFKDLLKKLKIPEDIWEVPFIYYNGNYLLGHEDILQNIDKLLDYKS